MIRTQGMVINKRVLDELDKYRIKRAQRSEAAIKREEDKRRRIEQQLTEAIQANRAAATPLATSLPTPPATPTPTPGGLPMGSAPRLNEGGGVGDAKKHNEINETAAQPSQIRPTEKTATGNLEARSQKPVVEERPINQSTQNDSAGADAGENEGSLGPQLQLAIGFLATTFGSEREPDTDKAMEVAVKWAKAYSGHAVLDAIMDYQAKRSDRTESRVLTDRLFGEYVRIAKANLENRGAPIQVVDKPAPKSIGPGPIAEGYLIDADGRLLLVNGVKTRWLEQFGGDEASLNLVLTAAKAKLKVNSPTAIDAQIEGYLAEQALIQRERAKNYSKAVESNQRTRAAAGSVAPDGAPKETQSDRFRRIAAAANQPKQSGGGR
jgi:hypothetical protein